MWKRMLRKRRGYKHTRGTFTPKRVEPTRGTTVARGTKQAKLDALLRLYEQGKITAEEYAERREELEKEYAIEKKVKKKRSVRYKNLLIDQELGTEVDPIQKAYTKWRTKCNGLSMADIGVTGRGNREGAGSKNLFQHMVNHVLPRVQRPGQDPKDGAWQVSLEKINQLITDKDAIIDEKDHSTLVSFIEALRNLEGGDKDPRNIPFTDPRTYKKVGDKTVVDTTKEIYGHYRTANYIDKRKKVNDITEKIGKVPSGWYSEEENSSKPPMWQALFAGVEGIPNGGAGDLLDVGLLKILEDFEKAIDGAYIEKVVIEERTTEAKIGSLLKLEGLEEALDEVMRNPTIYRSGSQKHYIKYKNGIIDRLNEVPFNGKGAEKYLKEIEPNLEEIEGSEDIREFSIKFTPATVNRLINLLIRPKYVIAPHHEKGTHPFVLSDAGGGRKTDGQPWSAKYDKAVKDSQIKKSWIDSLWG